MRINRYVAGSTGMSRRKADETIISGSISINGVRADLGDQVGPADIVTFNTKKLSLPNIQLLKLYKPAGYVSSRRGQGSKTIYELLPVEYHHLKPVGRLDKDTSGIILLTNDGELANQLTHPSYQKSKVYEITLSNDFTNEHWQQITRQGIALEDGISKFRLDRLDKGSDKHWLATLKEGRNRQIRRSFEQLGYTVTILHRKSFGPYHLEDLSSGQYELLSPSLLQ